MILLSLRLLNINSTPPPMLRMWRPATHCARPMPPSPSTNFLNSHYLMHPFPLPQTPLSRSPPFVNRMHSMHALDCPSRASMTAATIVTSSAARSQRRFTCAHLQRHCNSDRPMERMVCYCRSRIELLRPVPVLHCTLTCGSAPSDLVYGCRDRRHPEYLLPPRSRSYVLRRRAYTCGQAHIPR